MPRSSSWTTDEQVQFLCEQIPAHQSAQGGGKLPQFWEELFGEWFIQFPKTDVEPQECQPAIRIMSSHSIVWFTSTYRVTLEAETVVQ